MNANLASSPEMDSVAFASSSFARRRWAGSDLAGNALDAEAVVDPHQQQAVDLRTLVAAMAATSFLR
jgi:hypothetical protein